VKIVDSYMTSLRPIVVKKRLTYYQQTLWTSQHGVGFDLLLGCNGEKLGHGNFPSASVLCNLEALCLRQLVAESTDYSCLADFQEVSDYLVGKVMKNLELSMSDTDFVSGFDKEHFAELMSSKSAAFITQMWDDFIAHSEGQVVKTFVHNRQIVKYEESSKGFGLTKCRGITIMKGEAYVYLYRILQIQKKIYADPFLSRWMIKGKTPDELIEQLSTIIEWTHRSQDISGFEKGILHCLREPLENKLIYGAFRLLGLYVEAEYFLEFVGANNKRMPGARKVSHEFFTVYLMIRCSGDFWTSLANGLVNISLILTGHRIKTRAVYDSIDYWWVDASRLHFVTEGDDALIPLWMWHDIASKLGMSYSLVSVSHKPGGSDFLKVLHYPIRNDQGAPFKLLNVLRALRSLSYVTMTGGNPNKIKFLLRAKALSMHYLSPGHPILYALCQRIGYLTAGAREYSGWESDVDVKWGVEKLSAESIRQRFPVSYPTVEMRAAMQDSVCLESPSITVDEQLLLERMLSGWNMVDPIPLTASFIKFGSEYVSLVGSSGDRFSRPVYDHSCDPTIKFLLDGLVSGFPAPSQRGSPARGPVIGRTGL